MQLDFFKGVRLFRTAIAQNHCAEPVLSTQALLYSLPLQLGLKYFNAPKNLNALGRYYIVCIIYYTLCLIYYVVCIIYYYILYIIIESIFRQIRQYKGLVNLC